MDAYNPGTPTGATITRSGDTLNIVLNNTVSDWTDVSGTGLFVLAEDLLEDNSILITFRMDLPSGLIRVLMQLRQLLS